MITFEDHRKKEGKTIVDYYVEHTVRYVWPLSVVISFLLGVSLHSIPLTWVIPSYLIGGCIVFLFALKVYNIWKV